MQPLWGGTHIEVLAPPLLRATCSASRSAGAGLLSCPWGLALIAAPRFRSRKDKPSTIGAWVLRAPTGRKATSALLKGANMRALRAESR